MFLHTRFLEEDFQLPTDNHVFAHLHLFCHFQLPHLPPNTNRGHFITGKASLQWLAAALTFPTCQKTGVSEQVVAYSGKPERPKLDCGAMAAE